MGMMHIRLSGSVTEERAAKAGDGEEVGGQGR